MIWNSVKYLENLGHIDHCTARITPKKSKNRKWPFSFPTIFGVQEIFQRKSATYISLYRVARVRPRSPAIASTALSVVPTRTSS